MGETPTKTFHRLKGLYRQWINPEQHSREDVEDAIIPEQLLQQIPVDICLWSKKHEPKGGQLAAKLSQQYLNAHKGVPPRQYSSLPRGTRDIRDRRHTGGNPGSWETRRSETDRNRDASGAFPLCSITTPKVISALVQLFSRSGFPEEILTSPHISPNETASPPVWHHRYLHNTVLPTHRYQEVPQASTSFSPFEQLYGWSMQGSFELLRKSWEAPASSPGNVRVVQYVLQMCDQLEQYLEEAQENLKKAQHNQKRWYDEHA